MSGRAAGLAVSRRRSGAVAILYVREVAHYNAVPGATSVTIPVANATTLGHLLTLEACETNGAVTGVTDTKGNTWTVDQTAVNSKNTAICSTGQNVAALTTADSITVTFAVSVTGGGSIAIHEWAGLDTSVSRVDQKATGVYNATTSRNAGTVTTTVQNALVLAAFGLGSSESSFTPGAGYLTPTPALYATANASIEYEYEIVAATGTYSPTGTGGTSGTGAGVTVVYKAAGSGGGGGGGGGLSFTGQTSWTRPVFSPARTVTFTTKAGLDSAVSSLAAGDLVQYTGTGALTISSSSTGSPVYTIASKNPASKVVFDFGCVANIWDSSKITANFVKFAYTGTTSTTQDGFYMHDCSNLTFYGGEFNTGNWGGAAIRIRGGNTNIYMWDGYVSMAGAHGIQIQPANPSTGAAQTIDSCSFRIEVNRFCMNPANDPHADKGTGYHGCLWQDTSHGTISNSTIALYPHDSLRPGETSAGQTWPEGGGGSGIEIGTVGDSTSTCTIYVLAVNLLMVPNATNPGSTGSGQTGGNAINLWGSKPLDGYVFGWIEGSNTTGGVLHGTATGGYFPGTPAMHVLHGRHTNTNQSTAGGNDNIVYVQGKSIVYDLDVL